MIEGGAWRVSLPLTVRSNTYRQAVNTAFLPAETTRRLQLKKRHNLLTQAAGLLLPAGIKWDCFSLLGSCNNSFIAGDQRSEEERDCEEEEGDKILKII